MPGGRELVAFAHTTTLDEPDLSLVEALSDSIGHGPTVAAIEVAGALAIDNRIMHATGCHVPARRMAVARSLLEQLGAMDFPNSGLVRDDPSKAERRLRSIVRRLIR